MVFMDEKDIKWLEDYLSSLELKDEVIIKYSFEGDINKPKYLLLYKTENGKVQGQLLGPYGSNVVSLKDIAKKGFKIAKFKRLEKVLKKKSKK